MPATGPQEAVPLVLIRYNPFRAATGHPAGNTDMVQHEIETEPDSLFMGLSNEILELIKPVA